MNIETLAANVENNDRAILRANQRLVRFNAAQQRRQQVTAIALELHRSIHGRWVGCDGIPPTADEMFATPSERMAFEAACQHLTAVFKGENE